MDVVARATRTAPPTGEGARTSAGSRSPAGRDSVGVMPTTLPGRRLGHELGWLAGLFALYNLGRFVAGQHVTRAFDHAARVWDVERLLRLPNEQLLQSLLLEVWPAGVEFANGYYAFAHFPVTLAFLGWMLWRRPAYYVWTRRSLVLLTAAALVGHLAYPLAPPRMLPHLGLVDTGRLFGVSVYSAPHDDGIANQFAAMPSLHVAWAVLVAVGVVVSVRTRWRWLVVAHPLVTVLVVVVTANHYWVDGLVGVVLLLAAMWLARRALPGFPARRPPDSASSAARTSRSGSPATAGGPARTGS